MPPSVNNVPGEIHVDERQPRYGCLAACNGEHRRSLLHRALDATCSRRVCGVRW